MTQTQTSPEQWLTRLVQIPSVTPAHAGPRAGVPGEAAIAANVAGWFAQFGGQVVQEDVHPGRPNTYGIWRNPESDRWIALDVHYDTVGVENMSGDPFSGEVREGRVWGRGSVDDKASLAVALAVVETLHAQGRRPAANLIIAAVADEEVTLGGARAFAAWLRENAIVPDELVVAEPTLCAPCYGHKGLVRMTFNVRGRSAHTSQPHLGRNAISAAAKLCAALDDEALRLQRLAPSPVGTPTLSLVYFNAGRAFNIVPDLASVSIDRRVVQGESGAEVAARLEDLARAACPLPVEPELLICDNGFFQPPESHLVRRFSEWTGLGPVVVPYGSDASAYSGGTVRNLLLLGPGSIDQAHGAEEWVAISELERLLAVYARWWGLADG